MSSYRFENIHAWPLKSSIINRTNSGHFYATKMAQKYLEFRGTFWIENLPNDIRNPGPCMIQKASKIDARNPNPFIPFYWMFILKNDNIC